MSGVPFIPENAPFTGAQRLWLNGYLAGRYSDASAGLTVGGGMNGVAAPAPPKPKVTLLWGSQSGNAEGLCEEFGEKLQGKGFDARVLSMEDHEEVDLTEEEHVLMVSSTWGEGDPPDNAVEFWGKLTADDHPRLENLEFSVLGLGDTNYLDFCAMGKLFDARLEALGAKRLSPRVDCDVDFEEPSSHWFESVLASLKVTTNGNGSSNGSTAPAEGKPAKVEGWSRKNPFPAKLITNRKLNTEESPRDTRHFEISLEGSDLEYEVGDVLGVFPSNCPDLVDDILKALRCDGEEAVNGGNGEETSLRHALSHDYGITSPSRKFIETFAGKTASAELVELLKEENKQAFADHFWGREIIDLLLDYPDHRLSAAEFISMLGKMAPRLYSISSSPKAHPGEVHLTVARVSYDSHGRQRKGVASCWMSDSVGEDTNVPVFLQAAKHFKLPTDLSTPVIMVGPGTGIAPFRAFLEERKATEASGGNWLFFGNPHRKTDFLYKEEITAMIEDRVLSRFDTAWSRDQETRIYVQQRMTENAEELWRWLHDGAHFYVCGDARRMAKDVDDALHAVISTEGGMSAEAAADYVNQMKKDKRYQRDVY